MRDLAAPMARPGKWREVQGNSPASTFIDSGALARTTTGQRRARTIALAFNHGLTAL